MHDHAGRHEDEPAPGELVQRPGEEHDDSAPITAADHARDPLLARRATAGRPTRRDDSTTHEISIGPSSSAPGARSATRSSSPYARPCRHTAPTAGKKHSAVTTIEAASATPSPRSKPSCGPIEQRPPRSTPARAIAHDRQASPSWARTAQRARQPIRATGDRDDEGDRVAASLETRRQRRSRHRGQQRPHRTRQPT